jgi:hypothetical protein
VLWRQLLAILYGGEPGEFQTSLGVDAAVTRLRATTKSTVFQTLFSQSAVGSIRSDKVSIRRYRPFISNDFAPRFVASFTSDGKTTLLKGTYRMSTYIQVFMTVWLGFAALWTLMTLLLVVGQPDIWFFPIFGSAMLAAGIGFLAFARWLGAKDIQWLANHIETSLQRAA